MNSLENKFLTLSIQSLPLCNGKIKCPEQASFEKLLSLNIIEKPRKGRVSKWTLESVKQQGKDIHGDKYDYSLITEAHVKCSNSYIPVKCITCDYTWNPSIHHHINHKSGCPDCAGRVPWTLERFLERSCSIHSNKYDYSMVTGEHIQGKESHIPIKCFICAHLWEPSIHSHINGKTGCPDCAGRVPWTLERFLKKSYSIHGDKYNYSMVVREHIQGKDSKVPIKCNICNYIWAPTIHSHIYNRYGCPNCAELAPVTLNIFLEKVRLKHGDKYDYSLITSGHIHGNKSKIPVKCNKCKNIWTPRIDQHMNVGSDCPTCSGNSPWTLDRFLKRAYEIHGNKYSYLNIISSDIINSCSRIPIKCNKCNHIWHPNVNMHINTRSGCPKCKFSKGEIICANVLDQLGITYEIQYSTKSLPTKRYDFMFMYNEIPYLLEFDGQQHFEYNSFFHIDEDTFLNRQQIDIIKTYYAIYSGYHIIRISYKDMNNILYHITNSIASGAPLYFSDLNLYQYILSHKS